MATEIERALLQSLSDLQREHERQLNAWSDVLQSMRIEHAKGSQLWAEAAKTLQGQYERTQAENRALAQQVSSLSEQVSSLVQQVRSLSAALPQ